MSEPQSTDQPEKESDASVAAKPAEAAKAPEPKVLAEVDEKFRCGTLQYTKAGLFMVFSWLLWGDFCFQIFESAGGPGILSTYLQQNYHISNVQVNILFNFIPMIIGTFMTPIISFKSDRCRSRWGRRIPYMLFTAPFLCLFAAALGFSDDIMEFFKARLGEESSISPMTAGMCVIGFLVIGHTLFNEFVGTVYWYLFADVVPQHFLGRFMGLFRVVSTAAGFLLNVTIVEYNISHMKAIHVGVAVLYFFGFGLMCWRVKEGEYPPVTDVNEKTTILQQVKIYFKECFTHPIFILIYLMSAASAMTRGTNPAGVFGLQLGQHKADIVAHQEILPTAVAIGGDGKLMASGEQNGTVKFWRRFADGSLELVRSFTGNDSPVVVLALSSPGKIIAAGSESGTVLVWDTEANKQLHSLKAHDKVVSLSLSDDGNWLASVGADKAVKLWDVRTGQSSDPIPAEAPSAAAASKSAPPEPSPATAVALSPDGKRLAIGAKDGTVKCWERANGKPAKLLKTVTAKGEVHALAFTSDDKAVAVGSASGAVELFSTARGTRLKNLSHGDDVRSVAITASGTELVSADCKTIKIWDAYSGDCIKTQNVQDTYCCVAMTPDGKLVVSGGADGKVDLWQRTSEKEIKPLRSLEGKGGPVLAVAISEDGKLVASGSSKGLIEIWDATAGQCTRTLTGHAAEVRSVTLSKDGTQLASGGADKTIKIWDLQSGECLKTLAGHEDRVNCVAFSGHADRLVSGGADKKIIVWDVKAGTAITTLEGHPGPVYSVCFAPALEKVPPPEKQALSLVAEKAAWILSYLKDVFSNESLYETPPDKLSKIVGEDQWVLSGGRDGDTDDQKSIGRIWSIPEGKVVQTLTGHKGAICSIVYKPDCRTILSGSKDTSVRLWKPLEISASANDQAYKTISGYTHAVTSVAATPTGPVMVNVSNDGTLHAWDIDQGVSLRKGGVRSSFFMIIGILLAYPFGAMVDRFHPIRMLMWVSVLALPLSYMAYWWVQDYMSGVWLEIIRTPFFGLMAAASSVFLMVLFPKEKYGQMCSANALVRQAVAAVAGILGALLMDYLTASSLQTDSYRCGYLFQGVSHTLSTAALFGVYIYWKRLGADKYVAPKT